MLAAAADAGKMLRTIGHFMVNCVLRRERFADGKQTPGRQGDRSAKWREAIENVGLAS